ncbi:MAG: 3-deoxy-manno-octulosonate cytidylyltransferase [candidate division WOR-3 bacterium]
MKVISIIPARYGSKRLPGKPLVKILDKILINWVYDNARKCKKLDKIVIATDDERILKECEKFGAEVYLTPKDLKSGSDRVFWTYKNLIKENYDYILNLQGDEPLISPDDLDFLIEETIKRMCEVSTLGYPLDSKKKFNDKNIVKIVCDKEDRAIYFSRSPIPFSFLKKDLKFLKHIGVYLYRRDILELFHSIHKSYLEEKENLEQLRLIENGIPVFVFEAKNDTHPVDTEEDIKEVEKILRKKI